MLNIKCGTNTLRLVLFSRTCPRIEIEPSTRQKGIITLNAVDSVQTQVGFRWCSCPVTFTFLQKSLMFSIFWKMASYIIEDFIIVTSIHSSTAETS